jgi:uncharacterized NAD(P)/FAD-binding protein YdhS
MTAKTTLAIIGGGLSGAAVAYHLAGLLPPGQVDVVVVEPRPELGRGLAYSARDPEHRLNVPSTKMSLRTDQMDHFNRWLASGAAPVLTEDSVAPSGDIFAPRQVFGEYVAAQIQPLLAQGRLRHVRAWVVGVDRNDCYHLALSNGETLAADILVLATTHPKAVLPKELQALEGDPGLIDDPLAPAALETIDPKERILIVGNGLTSADIVASLKKRGHLGKITALSRHGWQSMPHGPKQAETAEDFAVVPEHTALGLLRRVRQALASDAKQCLTWHAVFDRLRAQGPIIWAALPEVERRRFLRHLRALWDIHRFRIAPQTHTAGTALKAEGRLASIAARIVRVSIGPSIDLTLRLRGARATAGLTVDRVILATGPAHGSVIETVPALADLADMGLVRADPLKLGLHVSKDGHALSQNGLTDGTLLVAGPLARGTVGELMGVPEVISWAEHIAREAANQIRLRRAGLAAE